MESVSLLAARILQFFLFHVPFRKTSCGTLRIAPPFDFHLNLFIDPFCGYPDSEAVWICRDFFFPGYIVEGQRAGAAVRCLRLPSIFMGDLAVILAEPVQSAKMDFLFPLPWNCHFCNKRIREEDNSIIILMKGISSRPLIVFSLSGFARIFR